MIPHTHAARSSFKLRFMEEHPPPPPPVSDPPQRVPPPVPPQGSRFGLVLSLQVLADRILDFYLIHQDIIYICKVEWWYRRRENLFQPPAIRRGADVIEPNWHTTNTTDASTQTDFAELIDRTLDVDTGTTVDLSVPNSDPLPRSSSSSSSDHTGPPPLEEAAVVQADPLPAERRQYYPYGDWY